MNVHEMKGGSTAQGNAFGTLASACKRTIALTGTLLGGYASHMFHLQYRMNPQAMAREGFSYGNRMNFANRYGVVERVTRYYPGDDNICSKGKKGTTVTREKPGVSPAIFSNHLMGSTVFLHLQDIALDLPELKEEVVPVCDGRRPGRCLQGPGAQDSLRDEATPCQRVSASPRRLSEYFALLSGPAFPQ